MFGSGEIPAFGFRFAAAFFGRDALPFLFPAIVPLWHGLLFTGAL